MAPTGGHGAQAHAVDVEAAVAEVAEQHLVVVGGARAGAARLALGALPRVLAALADRVRAQLDARRVDCRQVILHFCLVYKKDTKKYFGPKKNVLPGIIN